MLDRILRAAALTGVGAVLAVSSATGAVAHQALEDDGVMDSGKETHAHDLQHGADTGHLPAVAPSGGLQLLSKTALKNVVPGKIADVGVLDNTAYLAAWGGETCTYNGVHVVDITSLTSPKEVAFIPSKEGSYAGEGVQALSLSTSSFKGDVLVTNNEQCKPGVGFGGMNIYDVTNPAHPTPLAVGIGDDQMQPGEGKKDAHETHSVFAWQAGSKAYAVMVDNEEALDVDILDITNPKQPTFLAEHDLAAAFPQILQPGKDLDEVFLHDMVVKEIAGRQIMLLSYWDAGYVKLDVTNPAKPTYVADSDFAPLDPEAAESGLSVPPEGNAHQAEFTADNKYVLAADEDFAPFALTGRNTTDGTPFVSSQGSDTPKLATGQTITGQTVYVGRACATDTAVPKGNGRQIAVIERGVCTFTEKVTSVTNAGGYTAAVVFNRQGTDGCEASLSMSVAGSIPTFGVAPRSQGFALFDQPYDPAACLTGSTSATSSIQIGKTGDDLAFSSYFDGWGYVHLYANGSEKLTELDTYAIPEAHDPTKADGFGDLSVHEVATSAKKASVAYVSYYAGGLRVVDVSSGEIVEKAAHIDAGGNNFWGIETFMKDGKEYVAASDRDLGLYLYEYAPVNSTATKSRKP